MVSSLTDQVVLITGASAGIGEAVTLQAATAGAKLVLAARREGVLQTIKDLLEKQGTQVLVVPTDMSNPTEVTALAERALDHFGRVDILINNAGYGQMGPVEEVVDAAVRQQFEVNVFGLLSLTRALIPHMRQRGRGRIINLSSVAGQISMPFSGVYNASKYALEALSDALRVELAPFGIHVIVIEPGPVATEFFRVAEEKITAVVGSDSPYLPVLESMDEISSSIGKMAWPVDKVAKQILKAMTDPSPAERYTAFTGGKLGLGLIRVMPAAWSDRMWNQMFGIAKLNPKNSSGS